MLIFDDEHEDLSPVEQLVGKTIARMTPERGNPPNDKPYAWIIEFTDGDRVRVLGAHCPDIFWEKP